MKILKTYLYSYQAHLDLAKLKDEGLEAVIRDNDIVSIDPVLAQAAGGIKILVNDIDFNKAFEILKANEYDSLKNKQREEEISAQRKCSNCGSINIFQKGSWLVGLLFLFFSFILFTTKKSVYVGMDCSHKWNE
ncbi:MAG: hypothetical protein ACM34N_09540 [Ignavibacteria bacterium]